MQCHLGGCLARIADRLRQGKVAPPMQASSLIFSPHPVSVGFFPASVCLRCLDHAPDGFFFVAVPQVVSGSEHAPCFLRHAVEQSFAVALRGDYKVSAIVQALHHITKSGEGWTKIFSAVRSLNANRASNNGSTS